MPLMEWSPRLSVGIVQFDEEHKRLVKMLNDLFDAMQAGRGTEVMGAILSGLISYTKTHFANEERFMQQHRFPELAAHRAEHAALAEQVLAVQDKFKRAGSGAALSMQVLTFLKGWLVEHIQGTDKKYGPYLNARGIR